MPIVPAFEKASVPGINLSEGFCREVGDVDSKDCGTPSCVAVSDYALQRVEKGDASILELSSSWTDCGDDALEVVDCCPVEFADEAVLGRLL